MRVASLLLLFALSVTIAVAASQAPVGVATLLAPNWKNPGAYLTDFAFIAPNGSVYKRTTGTKFYGALAVNEEDNEVYAASCDAMPCQLSTFDLTSFALKSSVALKDLSVLSLRYHETAKALIAVLLTISSSSSSVGVLDPSSGKVKTLFALPSSYANYDSRAALDTQGNQFFYVTYPYSHSECFVMSYDFSTSKGSKQVYDCSQPFTCNTPYVSNVQYLPSTKSLYFVPRGSDLFCSLDPVSGSVSTVMNMTSVTGVLAQGQYFGSMADIAASTYWVQLMTPLLPLQVFWAQITVTNSGASLVRGADGPEIFEATWLQ